MAGVGVGGVYNIRMCMSCFGHVDEFVNASHPVIPWKGSLALHL